MIELLFEPFSYDYMNTAMVMSAAVGGVCAFLSCFLMLKGWSLIGDALSHAVVPGVAIAYALGLPFAVGAFLSGFLATLAILWIKSITALKEDAVIGFIFTFFFALGLFIISINPTAVNVQEIIFGNILGIASSDVWQVGVVMAVAFLFLVIFFKDLTLTFFDEVQAVASGLNPKVLKVLFFSLLSACVVASLQTVGAILVISMVVTPGATAYQLSDKFSQIIKIAIAIGVVTGGLGVYLSYFLDGATGGVIVSLQGILFILAFLFSSKFGYLRQKRLAKHQEPIQ
ncbi:metal ABC transporter permease [Moraxella nasicaprae]|uniref:Metal ABC transporter permease n=1 Tax=Moraxella nasicaprae TaxID=2904122 RepID=A0ABY6F2C7_9GAMM|nr:metal ABC transporter permease [Moraxella nasicaprae]UXZ04070.1 metal ABC transporter permease [Moraxella nasicaprae]